MGKTGRESNDRRNTKSSLLAVPRKILLVTLPRRTGHQPKSIRLTPIVVVMLIAALLSVTFQILLPVVPVLLERNGPHGAAGAATATLFVAMVSGELVTPWLQSKVGISKLLIAGALLLALPSLVYAHPLVSPTWIVLATAVRGFGMGVAIVVCVVLATSYAPSRSSGRAIGYFGLATGIPGVVVPSIGLWLLNAGRTDLVALFALSSAVMAGLLGFALRPRSSPPSLQAIKLSIAIRRPGLGLIFASLGLASCTYGGIVTFIPIALPASGASSAALFFLLFGGCRAIGRWLSGLLADFHSGRRVFAVGLALSAGGLVAVSGRPAPAFVLLGAIAYGFGIGAVQTGAYICLAERSPSSESTWVSALWNSALDIGSATGGAMLGLGAAFYGYSNAFWLMPLLALISLPVLAAAGGEVTMAENTEGMSP